MLWYYFKFVTVVRTGLEEAKNEFLASSNPLRGVVMIVPNLPHENSNKEVLRIRPVYLARLVKVDGYQRKVQEKKQN